MAKIFFIDTTCRDGVQTPRICLSKLQKTLINIMLDDMGVFESEFGFPTASHETAYLNANIILAKQKHIRRIRLAGWARALPEDVRLALENVPELRYLNLDSNEITDISPLRNLVKLTYLNIMYNFKISDI